MAALDRPCTPWRCSPPSRGEGKIVRPGQPSSKGTAGAAPPELAQALRLQQAGDLAGAERLYRDLLLRLPGEPDVLHLLGLVQHQKGDSAAALPLIAQALAARPDSAIYRRNQASILAGLGRLEEAAEAYEALLALTPGDAEAQAGLAGVCRHVGRWDEAAARYRRALELRPGSAPWQSALGDVLQGQGDLDGAAAAYRAALGLDPDFGVAESGLGNVLREQGRLEEALTHCRRAVELAPDYPQGHSDLGYCLQELGRQDEALAAYRKAVALDRRLLKPIMMKIPKAAHGRLWLQPSKLKALLLEAGGSSSQPRDRVL